LFKFIFVYVFTAQNLVRSDFTSNDLDFGNISDDNIEFAKAKFLIIVELAILKWFASIKWKIPLLIAKLEMKEQFKKEADALWVMWATPPSKAEFLIEK
jgi:hypothetical protein